MSGTQKAGSRIEWLDLEKGLAMILVLIGHCMRDEMRTASPPLDLIYRMVYIFHMTCFIWISGCAYRISRNRGTPPVKALKSRLKRQFFPWFGYTLLIWAVFACAIHLPGIGKTLSDAGYGRIPLKDYLLRAVQANNPFAYHLWFLFVLMLLTAVVGLWDAVLGGRHPLAVWLVPALLGVSGMAVREWLVLGEWWRLFDYVTRYLPVYCLGIWMADRKFSDRTCRIWGVLGLCYIVVRAVWFSGFSGNSLRTELPALRFLIYLLADLLLPGVILLLGKLLEQGIIPRTKTGRSFLLFLGRNSLLIYLLHQPFCCAFLGLVLYGKLQVPALPTMAVCFAASVIVPWLAQKVPGVSIK